ELSTRAPRARVARVLLCPQVRARDLPAFPTRRSSDLIELQVLTHGPHARLGEICGAVFRVAGAKPLRHENLDLLLQEFLALIAKHLLALGIDPDDHTLPIHPYRRIRSRLEMPTASLPT